MRPSTRCCTSLSSGLAEMIRKYSVLCEKSVQVKHLIKKVSLALLNFTKSTARISKPSRKCHRRVHGFGYMTVPEMLETMHENDLFDMFLVFSNVVHILGVIYTCYIVFCKTIIQCVAQIENLHVPPQHHVATTKHRSY